MTLRRLSVFPLAFMLLMTFAGDSLAVSFTPSAEISSDVASADVLSSDIASPDLRNESNSDTRRKRRRFARYKEESPPPWPGMSVSKSKKPGMALRKHESMRPKRRPRYDNFSDRRQKNKEESLFASSARDNMAEIEFLAETALAYDPEDYLTAYNTSKAAYDIADYEKAMKWIEKALSISPRYIPALILQRKITKAMKNR